MTSTLSTPGDGLINERSAPFTFGLRLKQGATRIQMPLENWNVGAQPLPDMLAPRSEMKDYVGNDDRYRFDVSLSGPLVGLLVYYHGWLVPEHKGRRP